MHQLTKCLAVLALCASCGHSSGSDEIEPPVYVLQATLSTSGEVLRGLSASLNIDYPNGGQEWATATLALSADDSYLGGATTKEWYLTVNLPLSGIPADGMVTVQNDGTNTGENPSPIYAGLGDPNDEDRPVTHQGTASLKLLGGRVEGSFTSDDAFFSASFEGKLSVLCGQPFSPDSSNVGGGPIVFAPDPSPNGGGAGGVTGGHPVNDFSQPPCSVWAPAVGDG